MPKMKHASLQTVGELKAFLASLPDDMPLHHRGDIGDQPRGLHLLVRTLAEARHEQGYFADIERDALWSKPQYRETFGQSFKALCAL